MFIDDFPTDPYITYFCTGIEIQSQNFSHKKKITTLKMSHLSYQLSSCQDFKIFYLQASCLGWNYNLKNTNKHLYSRVNMTSNPGAVHPRVAYDNYE